MKNLYLLFTLLVTTQLFCQELAWVDEQIEAIKPERIGVSQKEISKINDPFIFLHKTNYAKLTKKRKEISPATYSAYKKVTKHRAMHLRLEAILNKSAMINGKWYKQGISIYGYKLKKVNRESILLIHKNKKLFLSTRNRNRKIKISNR